MQQVSPDAPAAAASAAASSNEGLTLSKDSSCCAMYPIFLLKNLQQQDPMSNKP